MGKANAAGNSKIPAVRLDADELAFKPVPMLGPLEKLQPAAVIAVEEIRPNGSFNVFKPVGSQQWVALPAWSALSAAKVPFAVLVGNTGSLRGAGDLSDREEPALLIVDKADQTPPRRPSSSCASPPSSSPAAAAPRSSTCTAGRMSWRWSATGRARDRARGARGARAGYWHGRRHGRRRPSSWGDSAGTLRRSSSSLSHEARDENPRTRAGFFRA